MKTSTINKVSFGLAIVCFYFALTWLFPMSHISFSPVITFESAKATATDFEKLTNSFNDNDRVDDKLAEALGQPWAMQQSPIAMNTKSLDYIETQLNVALDHITDEAAVKELKAAKRDLAVVQERSWKTRYVIQDYIGKVQAHLLNAMEAYDKTL